MRVRAEGALCMLVRDTYGLEEIRGAGVNGGHGKWRLGRGKGGTEMVGPLAVANGVGWDCGRVRRRLARRRGYC